MIGHSAFANAASAHTADDLFVAHLNGEDCVDMHTHAFKCLCLSDRTREAVEDETATAVIGKKIISHDAVYDLVGHEGARRP